MFDGRVGGRGPVCFPSRAGNLSPRDYSSKASLHLDFLAAKQANRPGSLAAATRAPEVHKRYLLQKVGTNVHFQLPCLDNRSPPGHHVSFRHPHSRPRRQTPGRWEREWRQPPSDRLATAAAEDPAPGTPRTSRVVINARQFHFSSWLPGSAEFIFLVCSGTSSLGAKAWR